MNPIRPNRKTYQQLSYGTIFDVPDQMKLFDRCLNWDSRRQCDFGSALTIFGVVEFTVHCARLCQFNRVHNYWSAGPTPRCRQHITQEQYRTVGRLSTLGTS